MVSVWQILYPYSTSRRISKMALFGVLGLLTLYIVIFLRTAADIVALKRQMTWYQSRVSKVASFIGENILKMDMSSNLKTDWQVVDLPPEQVMVYSAFLLENRDPDNDYVFIIGSLAPSANLTTELHCIFYFDLVDNPRNTEMKISTTANYSYPRKGRRSTALLIICPLPRSNSSSSTALETLKPVSVSIQGAKEDRSGNITRSTNLLRIEYRSVIENSTNNQYQFTFSVCVLPTYDEYDDVLHFLEWLEYYRMLGVEEFTFYKMRIGPKISCILDDLVDHGWYPQVNVYPWGEYLSAQQQLQPKIYGRGIAPSLMDCHFRHIGISKYVLLIDSNDFLVPLINATTLEELLARLNSSNSGQFLFHTEKLVIPEQLSVEVKKTIEDECINVHHNLENFQAYRVCQKLWSNLVEKTDEFQPYSRQTANSIIVPDRMKMIGFPKPVASALEGEFKRYLVSEKIAYFRHYLRKSSGKPVETVEAVQEVNMKFAERVTDRLNYYMETCQLEETDVLLNADI